MAREHRSTTRLAEGETVWTVFAGWTDNHGGTVEEIDIVAARGEGTQAVEAAAREILTRDYQPGWEILQLVERPRGIWF